MHDQENEPRKRIRKMSHKDQINQIKYLTDIAKKHGLTVSEFAVKMTTEFKKAAIAYRLANPQQS